MPFDTSHKLAFRLGGSDLARLQAFAGTVLDALPVHKEPDFAAFYLPNGGLLELYGPGAPRPPYLFAHGSVVTCFRVPDLSAALLRAQAVGLRLVGDVEHICLGLSHCHLALPDGLTLGLYQEDPHS